MAENNVSTQLPIIITKEVVKGRAIYVAETPAFEVASQGCTQEEAIENLKEAVELYLEDDDAKQVDVSEISLSVVPIKLAKKA